MDTHGDKAQQDSRRQQQPDTADTTQELDPQVNSWHLLKNTPSTPYLMKPKTALQLQRTIGNQAVTRLVGQSTLQRDVDEETMTWATDTNDTIERIQDAVSGALRRLNADATTAIGHIRDAQGQYDRFTEMYDSAVGRFVSGVEAAQAREKEFRDNVKFVATTIFASVAPTASGMYSAIDGTLSKVQRVSSIVNMATVPAPAADTSGGTSPGMAARRGEDRIDWSELLSTTLTSFENTVQNNASLNEVSDSCVQIVRFLTRVKDGRYTGDSPRSDALATKADRMTGDVDNIISELESIGEGTISGPTETLKNQITERLNGITSRQLEQDIAIRWMGGLGDNDLDQIDLADAYLAQIGVFDSGNNRLDYDTGNITTDIDERILHWRAQWESVAMGLVGARVTWLGNSFAPPVVDDGERCLVPRVYSGQVRDSHNREWTVNVPNGATPEGGGEMILQSYEFDRMDSSGWEWEYPGDLRQMLQSEIRFSARAAGPLGGGAPAAGPVIHAAGRR